MEYDSYNLLTLHRPSKLTKLFASVSKPSGSVPLKGLPIWKELPLDAKLPIVPSSKASLVFTREKIGRKLWRRSAVNDFVLYDPNCYEVSSKYEALHDKNLYHFFAQKCNREHLRRMGLITKDNRAVCSLKEYNEYRRYLKRLYMDSINTERQLQDQMQLERLQLRKADLTAQHDMDLSLKAAFRSEKSRHDRDLREKQKMDKELMEAERAIRYNQRCEHLQLKKQEQRLRLKTKGQMFNEKISNRIKNANTIERRRKIKARHRMRDTDVRHKACMEYMHMDKRRQKEVADLKQWERKLQMQKLRLDYEKDLLFQYQQEMDLRVAIRNKNVEVQRLQMDELLQKIKSKKLKSAKAANTSDAILKAISKAWGEQHPKEGGNGDDNWLVEKSLQATLAELRYNVDGAAVITIVHGAKEKLEKEVILPEEVSYAIETLLNNVVKEHVKRSVTSLIKTVVEKAVQNRKKPTEDDRKQFMFSGGVARSRRSSAGSDREKSTSLSQTERNRSFLSERRRSTTQSMDLKVQRGVSFGAVKTIESSMAPVSGQPLLPTKDRPPTPVPSITAIVEAVFEEPEKLELTDGQSGQQKDLEKLLQSFSKILLKNVQYRAGRDYDIKCKTMHRRPSVGPDIIKMPDVVNKVAEKLLNTEEEIAEDCAELQIAIEAVSREVVRQYFLQDQRNLRTSSRKSLLSLRTKSSHGVTPNIL